MQSRRMQRDLRKILAQTLPLPETKAAILAAWRSFIGSERPIDDCTFLLFEVDPVRLRLLPPV